MADYAVRGTQQVERAAKAIKAMGSDGKQARKEMLSTIRATTKPLQQGLKGSARATLPKRGGLAALVASSPITTSTRTTGNQIGVRIRATGGSKVRDIRSTDRGRLRHPVFARSDQTRREWTWVNQSITPGWWSKPLEAFGPKVRRDLLQAMSRVVKDLERKSR